MPELEWSDPLEAKVDSQGSSSESRTAHNDSPNGAAWSPAHAKG